MTEENLRIKETPVQVKDVVNFQGSHQKDHLQICIHRWDVAKSSWEASAWPSSDSGPMLCTSQIQARSFIGVAESSKPWWGMRERTSSHKRVDKQLSALLWAVWSKTQNKKKQSL